jgi:hypothetical protein
MKQTPPREACSCSADDRISRVFCNSMGIRFSQGPATEISPEPAKSSHFFLDPLLYYSPVQRSDLLPPDFMVELFCTFYISPI